MPVSGGGKGFKTIKYRNNFHLISSESEKSSEIFRVVMQVGNAFAKDFSLVPRSK
jgi:hypothetical protein